ncbi:MAG: nucleotidyltransferase family protein [Jatrophihabitans sp.]|uniref:nucleotidyltransferase family protein n=1 Tax=Jatrophihabitans sp. TaxID=1932789 RepID=UPI0039140952
MDPSPAATERVRVWARSALALESGRSPRPSEPSNLTPHELLAAVYRHRLVELLGEHADALELPAPIPEQLSTQRRRAQRSIMVQSLEIGRIAAMFSAAGIRWLSLKGPALAVQTTGAVDGRGGGDIDVFVAAESVEETFRLLMGAGWAVRAPNPGDPASWAWRHVLRTYNEMTFDGPHSSVDVHWRLDPTLSALPDFETAWSHRVDVELPGITVATLSAAAAFSHTCHHAAKDEWRWLRSLVDVHRLARAPDVWTARELSRLELATLAVTDSCVGLPDGLPPSVQDQLRTVSGRAADRARRAQDRPVLAENAVPGAHMWRATRYRLSASRAPADLRIAVAAAALPAGSVAGLTASSAWAALPRLVARRLGRLLSKVAIWMGGGPSGAGRAGGAGGPVRPDVR